ncbi:MAG: hypothetical protein JWM86_1230 [Thermoleophilia bacterium]|nr:hypothetical protein [Thermoleophilia bacterium]
MSKVLRSEAATMGPVTDRPPTDQRVTPAALAAAWDRRSPDVRAEFDELLAVVARLAAPGHADATETTADLDAAEWAAHRLAGVFGVFERTIGARLLRSLTDMLHGARDGAALDVRPIHASLEALRRETWT